MRLSGGTSRQGTLTQVTDEGTCGAAATSSAWRGTKSTQVYELRRKSRKRSALIGTAIGAGAGAILGAAGSSSCGQGENLFPCGRGFGAAVGAVAGAAVGALTGALIGGGQKKTLIYP